ncbi:MAG: efflux RND transporter periplasmic adaptor subunit [Chlamydiia bacterium]|nr:efflux RND transporter periplasmic adaptor subunit [Chlamydiia bacterium]
MVTLYGNVDVRQVDLGFRVDGKVAGMPFEEGDFVSQGTLLAWLDVEPYADQVLQAEANLQAIRFSLQNADEIFQRREELIESGGVSQEDYDNSRTTKEVFSENLKAAIAALGIANTNLEDTKLYAPTDGTILTRIREPGAVVLESDPVYTLSIISPVWVRAYIPEPLFGVVQLGMEADIYTDTKGGKVYKGKLGFISPVAEFTPKTVETTELRTDLVYRIRIYADNPDWGLKQGMPVTVRLKVGDHPN